MFLEVLRRVEHLAGPRDRRQRPQRCERRARRREAVALRALPLDEGDDLLQDCGVAAPIRQERIEAVAGEAPVPAAAAMPKTSSPSTIPAILPPPGVAKVPSLKGVPFTRLSCGNGPVRSYRQRAEAHSLRLFVSHKERRFSGSRASAP